ncbi:GGDEF domain-containing protein [Candidatus Saccharibacteria bacterium]|nr:GGDEF domain-containing protein [Candidatus Saccharibacteria bacterium]
MSRKKREVFGVLAEVLVILLFSLTTYLAYRRTDLAALLVVHACAIVFFLVFVERLKESYAARLRRAKHQRDTDALTGLLQKETGQRAVDRYLSAHPDDCSVLVVFDIDDFKSVNDAHGHLIGDSVLQLIGETARNYFRDDDILVRFGGDEFVLFLPDVQDRRIASSILRRFRKNLKTSLVSLSGVENVTCSFGAVCFLNEEKTFRELFARADSALYLAKQQKNSICFSPET